MILETLLDYLIIILLGLFSSIGIYYVFKNLIEKIMVKFGYIKIKYFTKNYRIQEKMAKPKGGKIKINDIDLPFNNSPGYIYFNSNLPIAFYKEGEINQINIDDIGKTGVDPDLFDKITASYFEAGKLFALRKNKMQDIMMMLLVVALIIMIIGFGYSVYKLNMLDEIAKQVAKLG
ncbi:MAG: hypothetical protein QXG39_02530 [Candidatus Aenigmatarchaeota archaeon]